MDVPRRSARLSERHDTLFEIDGRRKDAAITSLVLETESFNVHRNSAINSLDFSDSSDSDSDSDCSLPDLNFKFNLEKSIMQMQIYSDSSDSDSSEADSAISEYIDSTPRLSLNPSFKKTLPHQHIRSNCMEWENFTSEDNPPGFPLKSILKKSSCASNNKMVKFDLELNKTKNYFIPNGNILRRWKKVGESVLDEIDSESF